MPFGKDDLIYCFWQPSLSIHQAPLLRELAKRRRVNVAADVKLNDRRDPAVWTDLDYGDAEAVVVQSSRHRDEIVNRWATPTSVHIFSGLGTYPGVDESFRAVRKREVRAIGVMAERPRRSNALADGLKWARDWLRAARWGADIDFVLAMGCLGSNYYDRLCLGRFEVFEFGYFVDHSEFDLDLLSCDLGVRPFEVLYVGALVERKQVELLIRALRQLGRDDWELRIIGEGPEKARLEGLVSELGLAARVHWVGAVENKETRRRIAHADLLVLPSRYDGWGAVISEAVDVGTPVVCSDRCGAASLLVDERVGRVVPYDDVAALAKAIEDRLKTGTRCRIERGMVAAWSAATTSPTAGANYLEQIAEWSNPHRESAEQPRPSPPWSARRLPEVAPYQQNVTERLATLH